MKQLRPELCSTLLFTPANRPERFTKAGQCSDAQMVVLDLEDAVALDEKDGARHTLIEYLRQWGRIPADHPMITAIRINPISTRAGLKDISALVEQELAPDTIFLPKVQNLQEIELYSELLNQGRHTPITFIAAIETAVGLQNAHEIASHPSVAALGFGGADLAADLGVELSLENTQSYRARIVQAARFAGKVAWDVPYLDFKDQAGLIAETKKVKAMGYSAKIAIHPAQLTPIAEVFSPTNEEISEAQSILKIFKEAQGSACQYRGKMLDVPVVKKSQDLLDRLNLAY
ncbi:HpcH/HpaI aldolase/citrate lyase family protein [Dongshaea marina]|uniref:HpcH/HpaI aldolase/citrate lyase family protein n=1 Tax=Dongshaea marina TaxID=2047966 RepID=UPI00131F2D2D|nr:CoA ester lyase [Dongshaea marina]